jgi:hypothetical protein
MRLFRKAIQGAVCLLLAAGMMACAQPEEAHVEDQPGKDEIIDLTPINVGLYCEEDDNHSRMGQDRFLNLPGMVIFQRNGCSFVNKTSKVSSLFCFDSICNGELGRCSAYLFARLSDAVYQVTDDALYFSRTEPYIEPGTDGNLYALSLSTMEYKKVFQGNGSELRLLQVHNDFVYFARSGEGGFDWFRYCVSSGKTELIQPQFDKMSDVFIRYDQIFVILEGSNQLYQTNEQFSSLQETGLTAGDVTAIRYGKCYLAEKRDNVGTVDLYEYDIATQTERMIASKCQNFSDMLTVTHEYVYYRNQDKTKLSRCRIEDGETELIFDFSTLGEAVVLDGFKVYDGELYADCLVQGTKGKRDAIRRYGNIVQAGGMWTFVDFLKGDGVSNDRIGD